MLPYFTLIPELQPVIWFMDKLSRLQTANRIKSVLLYWINITTKAAQITVRTRRWRQTNLVHFSFKHYELTKKSMCRWWDLVLAQCLFQLHHEPDKFENWCFFVWWNLNWTGCETLCRVFISRRPSGWDSADPLRGDGVLHQTLDGGGHQHDAADPRLAGREGLVHTRLQPHRLRHQVRGRVSRLDHYTQICCGASQRHRRLQHVKF